MLRRLGKIRGVAPSFIVLAGLAFCMLPSCGGGGGATSTTASAPPTPSTPITPVTPIVTADTTAPSIPTGLSASLSSPTSLTLSWVASTDAVGVSGYKVYRSGTQVGTATTPSFGDIGLSSSTSGTQTFTVSYTVSAYDAAGNVSAQSAGITASTPVASVQIGTGTGKAIKALLGENAGPLAASPQVTGDYTSKYQSIGVRSVRTHDQLIYPGTTTPGWDPVLKPGPLDMSTMYSSFTKDPSLLSSYTFALSDTHFAAIVNGGFEPFFRLGDSAGLIKAPLPVERPNWVKAAVEVLNHYKNGKWSGFNAAISEAEIWNEPDSSGFWPRSKSEFMSLYTETATALRAAFPTLKIGGPGFTQGAASNLSSTGWVQGLLDQVKSASAPLDYLSFHIYSNDANEPSNLATGLRTLLDGNRFTDTKIYITEWNTDVIKDATLTLAQKQAYRAGALGASTLSAAWIKMQDAPIDRLFHYRGSDVNTGTPEDYGLYNGDGTPKLIAGAFQFWSTLAATTERLDSSAKGATSLITLAGKDSSGKSVLLVVNTTNAPTTWLPTDTNDRVLSGTWTLSSLSDASPIASTATATFPINIPAYGIQLLSAGN